MEPRANLRLGQYHTICRDFPAQTEFVLEGSLQPFCAEKLRRMGDGN